MDEPKQPQEAPPAGDKPPEAPTAPPSLAPISVKPIRASQKEFSFYLPCGYITADGKVAHTIVLRTITAGDRRMFGDPQMQENTGKLITALIDAKLVSLEGGVKTPQNFSRGLLAFDRDAIIYALRRETMPGRPFEEDVVCQSCNAKNHSSIQLDEVDATLVTMPDEIRAIRDKSLCVFDIDLPAYGFKGRFSYANGLTQEKLSATDILNNPFAAEFEILAQSCLDFNGEGKLDADGFAEMDTEFLTDLQREIRSHRYGYEFNPEVFCFKCKKPTRARVDPLDFLFEGSKNETRKTPTTSSR